MTATPDVYRLQLGDYAVVAYTEERCYGGSEEGGWWYNVTILADDLCSGPILAVGNKEECAAECRRLNDGGKVLSRGDLSQLGGDDTASSSQPEGYIPRGWSGGSRQVYYLEKIYKVGSHDTSKEPVPYYE